MQFDLKSGHVERYAVRRHVFPPCDQRPGTFATLEIVGERAGDRHPPSVCLFFDKPADLDDLIAEATALRADLARQIAADFGAKIPTPEALAREHAPEELVANDC